LYWQNWVAVGTLLIEGEVILANPTGADSMTKEGHSVDQAANPGGSPAVRQKLQELAELISLEQFGEEGIPKEITFSEIEEIGHQVGQLAAGAMDQSLPLWHAKHLAAMEPCPQCGEDCQVQQRQRSLQTRDGTVTLDEPVCHCSRCARDFFPSASVAETRRACL